MIQPGTATINRQVIKGATLAVPDENGNLIDATVDIPIGAVIGIPKK
jgi:hypothetical protein